MLIKINLNQNNTVNKIINISFIRLNFFKLFFFFCISLINIIQILSLHAADRTVIKGIVRNSITKEGLPGASIRIEGTAMGALSGKGGGFIINRPPIRTLTLIVSFIGYETGKATLTISKLDTHYIEIFLKEQPLQTGEVVISASKRLQAVQDVPISVSVIDSRILTERSMTKIDEALQFVPGVTMNNDQVNIRGSSGYAFGLGSRVALLVDGFPLLSGDNGDMKFDAVPIFDIDRIEIVKGAGSALYGTSALGGVINLITKEPKETPEFKLRTFDGLYTEPQYRQWQYRSSNPMIYGADAGYSQKWKKFGLVVSSGIVKDESYRLYDQSLRWNLFAKGKYDFSERTNMSIFSSYAFEKRDDWVYWNSLDSATFPPAGTNMNDKFTSGKNALGCEFKTIFDGGDFLEAKVGNYYTYFENSVTTTDASYRKSTANSTNAELQLNNMLSDINLMTTGINFALNTVNANIYGKKYQSISSVYSQTELHPTNIMTITLGGRFDYEQTDGETGNLQFSPKFGITYKPGFGGTFRISGGTGFRAPTVAERFTTLKYSGFTVMPNPNLLPERSLSLESGYNVDFIIFNTHIDVEASLFDNIMDDLIEAQFVSRGGSAEIDFDNITKARIYGAELSVKSMVLGIFGLETSITAMDPRDLTLNETLKYRSKFQWYNRFILPLKWIEFQLDYRYLSRVENVDARLGLQIKDYNARVPIHVLDSRVIFRTLKYSGYPLNFILNCKNMMDYYYTMVPGNLAPTRTITFQLDWGL